MEIPRPVLLLIENDPNDVFLFRRAFTHVGFDGTVRVVGSVSEARDYLEGREAYWDRSYFPIPDLIVSDMNLPGNTGADFLEWLRKETRFQSLPFVFLSGSFVPPDKQWAREAGAGAFFQKTGDFSVMKDRIFKMLQFIPENEGTPGTTGSSS